jgi:hypothetical protein
MCQLLWNDPSEDELKGYKENARGIGKVFGVDILIIFTHQRIKSNTQSLFSIQL